MDLASSRESETSIKYSSTRESASYNCKMNFFIVFFYV